MVFLGKLHAYLKLDDVENAKPMLILSKQFGDKMKQQNCPENSAKQINLTLYEAYYHFYSHDLINNVKKAIENGVEWLNLVNMLFKIEVEMENILSMSNYCIQNRVYRQSEYFAFSITF